MGQSSPFLKLENWLYIWALGVVLNVSFKIMIDNLKNSKINYDNGTDIVHGAFGIWSYDP
uniref:Uncharacterized protein n=1 Tax=Rhizophagus irregularis (strain DAOM 181602 / DAOM 197198 / MUCL 43194) TaxID=747089 RepID=U9TW80_RHIID